MYQLEKIKFEVYTNYLWGLSHFIGRRYPTLSDIKIKDGLEPSSKSVDIDSIRKHLFNAWNSERILNSPYELSLGKTFRKFANHWSPVLSYYSVFLCFQPLFILLEGKPILEHRTCLAKISSYIRKKRLPFIHPWNLSCWGCSYYNEENFNFEVSTPDIRTMSSLANPSFVDENVFMAKILSTTRKKEEEFLEEKWKRDKHFLNRNNSPKKVYRREEKLEISKTLPPTSIFNFLYRLRVRSNYEDADIFFLGDRAMEDVDSYFVSLITITDATLFFLESILLQSLGKRTFYSLIDSFAQYSGDYKLGIAKRKDWY